MKAALRERLVERMMHIPHLIDEYVQQQSTFVGSTLHWLKISETTLESTRSPVVSLLSTLRGQLMAIEDGLINHQIQTETRSKRKNRRALAAHVIQQADIAFREEIKLIDIHFDELRDKMAQLIALVSAKNLLPFSTVITAEYLDRIWQLLQQHEETQTMSIYIKTRTDTVDRHYLLQELLAQYFHGSEHEHSGLSNHLPTR